VDGGGAMPPTITFAPTMVSDAAGLE